MVGRELLDGGDDNARPSLQSRLQLARGAVDFLDKTLGLLELRHSVLKLAVKHNTIGNDDGRIEDRPVGIVMQVSDLMRSPADGVRFARTC